MNVLFTLFIVLHVLVCIFLVLLVMLQNDKGGGLAGAFGGMGGSAAFTGSGTATFLTKATWGFAAAFFILIFAIGAIGTKRSASRMGESELKGASKWISNALPARNSASGAIPGVSGSAPQGIPGVAPVQSQGQPAKSP